MRSVVTFAVAALLVLAVNGQSQLTALVDAKSKVLEKLATDATIAHRDRCTEYHNNCGSTGSLGCSLPACGNTFPTSKGFACNNSWGKNPELCTTNDGSGCNGLWTSVQEGTIRFAKETKFSDTEVAAFACASKKMDPTFRANDMRGDATGWQYVGSMTGASRFYPGQPQYRSSTCCPYDPRVRPWFITATAGPKDVVLVVDTSGSMGNNQRLEAMKATTNALLDSMTNTDYVGLVDFNSNAESFASTLKQGTKSNIDSMKSKVNGYKANGGTAMEKGFAKAFDLLSGSGEKSGCTQIIIFLTDGMANDPELVIPAVNAGQAKLSKKAHIFTYSLGSGADANLPKQIACENDGVWAAIADGSDPLSKMGQYYQFLAAGIDSTQVRWTTPYEDAFGLGQMVTGAVPVYDRSQSVPLLVGVVGTDVLMSELEKYGDRDTVVNDLISRSKTCPTITLKKCQMQHIRGTAAQCATEAYADYSIAKCNDRNEIVELKQCTPKNTPGTSEVNNVLCEKLDQNTQVVAGISKTSQEVACCSDCNSAGRTDSGVCRLVAGGSSSITTVVATVVALLAILI